MLRLDGVSVRHGARTVLRGVTLAAAAGTLTALIGPNGAGKSSLLRGVLGLLPVTGAIRIAGGDAASMAPRERARRIGYVPQDLAGRTRLTALEVVLLGRLDTLGWHVPHRDLTEAMAALDDLGLSHLAARPIAELSGGQRQLVFVAQALARHPAVLLLDEPTSALDLRHQLLLLGILRGIAESRSVAVVMALHDLNLALRFADQVAVLHAGGLRAAGPAAEVVTAEMVAGVFGVAATMGRTPDGPDCLVPMRALA